jgi:hypothetical protein
MVRISKSDRTRTCKSCAGPIRAKELHLEWSSNRWGSHDREVVCVGCVRKLTERLFDGEGEVE